MAAHNLDVLLAQQTLLNARVSLVSAEHDRVVISYRVVAAAGRLTTGRLGLDVTQYGLKQHYEQVKDKWFGPRTPDGQ